jgi:hypothetical protein
MTQLVIVLAKVQSLITTRFGLAHPVVPVFSNVQSTLSMWITSWIFDVIKF